MVGPDASESIVGGSVGPVTHHAGEKAWQTPDVTKGVHEIGIVSKHRQKIVAVVAGFAAILLLVGVGMLFAGSQDKEAYNAQDQLAGVTQTSSPTNGPTLEPTFQATPKPTNKPTPKPTFKPTLEPTMPPTAVPPTIKPTLPPSIPTGRPSELNGTQAPGVAPTPVLSPTNESAVMDGVTFVPGDLSVAELGLLLSRGLRARILAKSGRLVGYHDGTNSTIPFHEDPDFGATFPDTRAFNAGGWVYVSNSERNITGKGGVGSITFNKNGKVIDYRMVLKGTTMNCGGGRTPW